MRRVAIAAAIALVSCTEPTGLRKQREPIIENYGSDQVVLNPDGSILHYRNGKLFAKIMDDKMLIFASRNTTFTYNVDVRGAGHPVNLLRINTLGARASCFPKLMAMIGAATVFAAATDVTAAAIAGGITAPVAIATGAATVAAGTKYAEAVHAYVHCMRG